MSERERWIVYPLLFFALGAALRDKLTQSVESKNVVCQSLRIVDPYDTSRILAEIGTQQTGVLEGDIPVSYLRADSLLCEGMSVLDPEDPRNELVLLGSGRLPSLLPGEEPRKVGTIVLKNSTGTQLSEFNAENSKVPRLISKQMHVLDPEGRKSLVILGTQPMPGISLNEEDPAVSHQGVIILNNQYLGIRLAPPISPQSQTSP